MEYDELIRFGSCCGCISLVLWLCRAVDRFIDWTMGKNEERTAIERRLKALEDICR